MFSKIVLEVAMNPCKSLKISQLPGAILFIAALLPAIVFSLESDRDQSIYIESDRAEFHELEGYTVYSGNVRLSQGSILLEAAEISIYFVDGNVYRLLASGDRAYYEQLPAENEGKVVAQASTIEYLLQDDLINLIQNASLTQDGATLNGELITYDVRNHLLKANSRSDEQESGESGRVRVTIPSLGTGN